MCIYIYASFRSKDSPMDAKEREHGYLRFKLLVFPNMECLFWIPAFRGSSIFGFR